MATNDAANDKEEAELFASFSIENMETYEQNVLETAEREAAPRLTGIGFPSLETLAPSGMPSNHLQDFQKLLFQVREQIQRGSAAAGRNDSNQSTKLYLKHQMLLNLIQGVSSDMDFLLRPQEEYQQEMKRRRIMKSPTTTEPTTTTNVPRKNSRNINNTNNNNIKEGPKSASERLEAIKKGNMNPSKQIRKRISVQQRKLGSKRKLIKEKEQEDKDDEEEEDEDQDDEAAYRARLKKLRRRREKRRQKRKKQWQKAQEEEDDDDNDDDSEEEFEFEDDDEASFSKPKAQETEKAKSRSNPLKQMLQCPLCQESITIPNSKHGDEVLSQHMSICQTARTRGQRRQSSRGSSDSPPNYMQPHDLQVDNDDNDDNDDDDSAFESDKNVDDEEDLIFDDDDVSTTNESKQKRRKKIKSKQPFRYHRQSTALDDWYEDEYEDRVDDWIENGIERMRDMKERDSNEVPPGEEMYVGGLIVPAWINDRLFQYQRTGLQWLWELHQQAAGGLIGDEMGLGKTVQICAFLGSMTANQKIKSILIISPATMLQHWLSELKVWAPGIRRILIHQSGEANTGFKRNISTATLQSAETWLKGCRRDRLYQPIDEEDLKTRDPNSFCGTAYAFVTTYENVRRNPDIWTNHRWSYVVIDEAQKIRNPDADITLVCKRLKSPHRLALSGTPIQNDLRELWSIFDFVFPGRLGTLPAFEQEFADPIKRGGYSNASPMQVQVAYRCALILKDLINPYLLRRLKKDIKEVSRMPGKKEQVLFCRLTSRQRMLYESFLQSDLVKNVIRGSSNLLGAITMLRKICNHPDLVCSPDKTSFDLFLQKGYFDANDLDIYDDERALEIEASSDTLTERSGKLQVLAKILPLWHKQGHRVLIFAQWKKMLDIIQRFMYYKGYKFGRLDGNTAVASRQRLVDSFNTDDSYFAMLCTTRTGGVGLNLTGADRIILYDPDWNPQTDAQARERAWRFGQEREVTIFRLISAGTVEEKIYQRQIFKTALSNKVLQDARQQRLFSQKDLRDLFTLKADTGSIRSGGDGMTETGQITKGEGYIDPDEESTTKKGDEGETMRTVFKSKGLAGVFDHDMVEGDSVSKKASVREMEFKAKKIAEEAASALEQSVTGQQSYLPTWTGSSETQESRFGSSRPGAALNFASANSSMAGIHRNSEKKSSKSLLTSLKERNKEINSMGRSKTTGSKDTKEYTKLLKRISDFVKIAAPTTDELLDEFESVPNYDAAIFRRLLKSVASFHGGRWRLKK